MAAMRCKSCGHDNPPEARFCANCGSNLVAAIEQLSPAVVPSAEPATPEVVVKYMGFWVRFGAAIIDSMIVLVSYLAIRAFYLPIFGYRYSFLASFFWFPLPWLYYWLFTGLKGQTLGKMAVGIKVVNAKGSIPGLGRAALREVPGKIASYIVIFLGFLWVIWDGRKQGWHDKIAKTYVVKVELRR